MDSVSSLTDGRSLLYDYYTQSPQVLSYKMTNFLTRIKTFSINKAMVSLGLMDYDFSTNQFSNDSYGIQPDNTLEDKIFRVHLFVMVKELAADISKNNATETTSIYNYLTAKILKTSGHLDVSVFQQQATFMNCSLGQQRIEKLAK